MGKEKLISKYKGFELWDSPPPEGWAVHNYPVRVTCNGNHVNSFSDANEAMNVIDGMDAETVAYHTGKVAPVAPAVPDAGGADDSGYTELIDSLSGQIKRLERELAAARDQKAEMLGIIAMGKCVSEEDFNRARELATK